MGKKKLKFLFYRIRNKTHHQTKAFTPKCQHINKIVPMTYADNELPILIPFTKNSHSCLASISM